ncbi:MAG: amino acid--tRNA ligase-related protein, partial [Caldivirga sp.]
SESFDLVIDGMEVTSGSTRIHDRKQLEEAMKARGLNPENFAMHLEAYDWGMPPHAGWGLGLYRLMMVMAKVRNIREVILFPRDRYRLTP